MKRKRLCYAAVFSVCLALASALPAESASFNCQKAGTPNEKVICADPELSGLDEEMANLYKEGLKYIDNDTLKKEQRAWLKKMNECAGNVQCLKFAYQSRMSDLRSVLDEAYADIAASEAQAKDEADSLRPPSL